MTAHPEPTSRIGLPRLGTHRITRWPVSRSPTTLPPPGDPPPIPPPPCPKPSPAPPPDRPHTGEGRHQFGIGFTDEEDEEFTLGQGSASYHLGLLDLPRLQRDLRQ